MMNFSKFQFFGVYSSANLRQTVSTIDMVEGVAYNLGLCLSTNIVDGIMKSKFKPGTPFGTWLQMDVSQ